MAKGSRLGVFWRGANRVTKACTFIIAIGGACGLVYGGFSWAKENAPWLLKSEAAFNQARVEEKIVPLVQYAQGNLIAEQIALQDKIDYLAAKCLRGCSDYDRQSLNNFRLRWRSNQDILDRILRQQQQQQQQQRPQQQR